MNRSFSILLSCSLLWSVVVSWTAAGHEDITMADNSTTTSRELSSPSCGATKEAKVTIVGGGLAGIFAASVLELRGISYQLIEADDRWGGRLRSFESKFELDGENIVLEEAANFMYGKKKGRFKENPIWKLFRNYDVRTFQYDGFDWDTYDANGVSFTNNKVRRTQNKLNRSIRRCLDTSGEEWFEEFLNGIETPDNDAESVLLTCKQKPWEPDTPLKAAASHIMIETDNALPLEKLSRAVFPEDSFSTFGEALFFQYDQDGTSTMIENLVNDNLDPGKIQLDAQVTRVEFEGEEVITTALVNGCTQTYASEFAIVTVPMNILKGKEFANQIDFQPSLLNIEESPIDQNKVEKVWIQFSEAFWDCDRNWVVIANELEGGAATLFFNYEIPLPGSRLLMTFVREDQLEKIGAIDDAGVEIIIRDLKKLPHWSDSITYEWQATDWASDKFFSGSWEVWKVGKTYEEFHQSILPQGNLHKAGSGFCQNFWGFTWAAIMSGIWNAEWISERILDPLADPLEIAPYSPCEDPDTVRNVEMKRFYDDYGALFAP